MAMQVMFVAALAATAAWGAGEPTCKIPVDELKLCVHEVMHDNPEFGSPILQPRCCDKLAKELGCGCVLRDIIVQFGGLDLQKPFCPEGTGCKPPSPPPPPPY